MKRLLLFAQFIFILCAQSQEIVSVEERAVAMVAVIRDNHIQPREMNAEFSSMVHDNILASLDPDKLFFTKADRSALKEASATIHEQILNKDHSYVNTLSLTWKAAVNRALMIHKLYFEDPEVLEKVPQHSVEFYEEPPADKEAEKNRWHAEYRTIIISDIVDKCAAANFVELDDSLDAYIESSTKSVEVLYEDYLQGLSDDKELVYSAYLDAIAKAFDPHSNYYTSQNNESFKEELSAEREVYGITYQKNSDRELEITELMPGSSAWLSGEISVGDALLKIKLGDKEPVNLLGKSSYQLSDLFDGFDGNTIVLTIRTSDNAVKDVKLVKSKVYSDRDNIKATILNDGVKVGYISLPDFYTNWTDSTVLGCANDMAKTLIKMKRQGIEGLILDLRDNGGGSLKEAIDLTGIFIDYGPVMVVSDREKPYSLKDFNRGAIYTGPMIVLINENSASASEAVAGALQDYNRALIVGQRSFGKATGQGMHPLNPFSYDDNSPWGVVWVTDLGLYRITLKTNQINGVQPDVILEEVYPYDHFREESYPNPLPLDSVEKKMYYKPAAEMDIEPLIAKSKARRAEDALFVENKEITEKYYGLYDDFVIENSGLTDAIAKEREAKALKDQLKSLYNDKKVKFTVESLEYDEDVYRMDEILKTYRDDFYDRIQKDYELEETVKIMKDLINK